MELNSKPSFQKGWLQPTKCNLEKLFCHFVLIIHLLVFRKYTYQYPYRKWPYSNVYYVIMKVQFDN